MEILEHLEWALEEAETEHVSIRAFAENFNYTDRQTAEEAFTNLIGNTKIIKARRQRLEKSFAIFKANSAEAYWAKLCSTNQAGIIAMKAAADSMNAGRRQSKILYNSRFQNMEGSSSAIDSGVRGGKPASSSLSLNNNGAAGDSTTLPGTPPCFAFSSQSFLGESKRIGVCSRLAWRGQGRRAAPRRENGRLQQGSHG